MVCDVAMPGEDGCTLLHRIKDGGYARAMRMLALTGLAGEHDMVRTTAAGFKMHLAKPVDIDNLLTAISQLLTARDALPAKVAPDAGGISVALGA
jgi:CheY-like chemotaxis protein